MANVRTAGIGNINLECRLKLDKKHIRCALEFIFSIVKNVVLDLLGD